MGTEAKRFAVFVAASEFPALRTGAESSLRGRMTEQGYTIHGAPHWEGPRAHDMQQLWIVSARGYRPTDGPDVPRWTADFDEPEHWVHTGDTDAPRETTETA